MKKCSHFYERKGPYHGKCILCGKARQHFLFKGEMYAVIGNSFDDCRDKIDKFLKDQEEKERGE